MTDEANFSNNHTLKLVPFVAFVWKNPRLPTVCRLMNGFTKLKGLGCRIHLEHVPIELVSLVLQ